MKPRLVTTLQNTSTNDDKNTTRPDWPRNGGQILLDANMSKIQQFSSSLDAYTVKVTDGIFTTSPDFSPCSLQPLKLEDATRNPMQYQGMINKSYSPDMLTEQTLTKFFAPMMMYFTETGRTSEANYKWNESDGGKSDTSIIAMRSEISADIRALFRNAVYEVFEDGMDSDFGSELIRIIHDHGVVAIEEIEKLIHADNANMEVAAEALICTGRVNDDQTHRIRLSVLERALESDSVYIRDAASIAIEFMEDPAAINSIKKAISKEECELLQQNLRDVLIQLQDAT